MGWIFACCATECALVRVAHPRRLTGDTYQLLATGGEGADHPLLAQFALLGPVGCRSGGQLPGEFLVGVIAPKQKEVFGVDTGEEDRIAPLSGRREANQITWGWRPVEQFGPPRRKLLVHDSQNLI